VYKLVTLEFLVTSALAAECVGGFATQLALVATVPLIMVAFLAGTIAGLYVAHYNFSCGECFGETFSSRSEAARRGLAASTPIVLFLLFCFLPAVSREAFLSFACDGFGYNDANSSLTTNGFEGDHYFLRADFRVRCSHGSFVNPIYENIRTFGVFFVIVWPICITLAFALLLFAARSSITHRRPTRLYRATKFLHVEYNPRAFWWEIYDTVRKLILTGFLLLIPPLLAFVRLFLALIISVGHLVLLLSTKPYENPWDSVAALAAAGSLVMTVFTMLLGQAVLRAQ
jgi:hypothetical protein